MGREPTVAYLILAHADPVHLERLVHALDHHARVFIHLDAKSDDGLLHRVRLPERAKFISERTRVSWGSFSMVSATLALIRAALAEATPLTRLVLLSGADYPIKPPAEIHRVLTDNPGREFIRYLDARASPEHYLRSATGVHFREPFLPHRLRQANRAVRAALELLARPIRRRLPEGIVPAFGSQWWAISPALAVHFLEFVERRPEVARFYRRSLAPDEQFFHTIVANSPFAQSAGGIQAFEGRGTYRMANLHVIDPSLRRVFTIDDWPEIAATRTREDKLFLRKVETGKSAALLDRIDAELRDVSL